MTDVAKQLQQKIRATIPLSEAMQFSIDQLSLDGIVVSAPLKPNINIHGTGFAGSIYSVAVLSGWALCMHIMEQTGMEGDLVVGKAEIRYRSAVTADMLCSAGVSAGERETFVQDFLSSGKAKLLLQIEVGNDPNAILQATYFAVRK